MTIIHPTDFSDAAQGAERQAVRLARALSAKLIILHALGELPLAGIRLPGTPDNESIRARQRQDADQALRVRDSVVRELGVAARWIVREGAPAEAIVRAAADERADLIVIGTHGRSGLDRLLIGGVADRVVRLAPCPVMTVRREPGQVGTNEEDDSMTARAETPMRLLCPTDFSESADRAQRRAVGLARALGAELVLLHVTTDPSPLYNEGVWGLADAAAFVEGQRKWATGTLQSRADTIARDGIAARAKVVAGVPVDEIVRAAAEEGVAFIVMGTHGRGQLDRLLLGSVADRVIRLARCPVMTVREGIEQ